MKPALASLAFAAALACAFPSAPRAQSLAFTLDPARTEIHWTLGGTLHTVHGTFALKRGALRLDPSSGQASGQIVVDTTSGQSANTLRDRRMHKEILESAKFPEAVFTPDKLLSPFDPTAPNQKVDLHGSFLIHGAAHELILHLATTRTANSLTATATFSIPYIAWGMKNPSNFLLKVDNHVDMEIKTTVTLPK